MLLVDVVHTLANVVIIDPIQIDLVSLVVFSHGVVATIIIQGKDGLYCDWFPADMFSPLAIKVFGFLHQQAHGFFHRCANMVWGGKMH
jgi:hypothetical protein